MSHGTYSFDMLFNTTHFIPCEYGEDISDVTNTVTQYLWLA